MPSLSCSVNVRHGVAYCNDFTRKTDGCFADKEQEDTSPTRNAFKVRAFQSAIKVINQLDHPLRSVEEAKSVRIPSEPQHIFALNMLQLKGVGPGITQRIELYLTGQNYVRMCPWTGL
jgi:hypothetical protein